MEAKFEVKFLGRTLGTASSWDGDLSAWWIYDFIPSIPGLSACPCLSLDNVGGWLTHKNEQGETIGKPLELVEFLHTIPRDPA